jgi:NTP pyrophosphatase (non-canonical NTP hydrolase)
MTLDEYQKLAARTINPALTVADAQRHALHEIASECGEIHGLYQKTFQGHALDEHDLILEIGDLLWGIAELCTAHGWSLDMVANFNIEKLKKRYPHGFDAEKSMHREASE